MHYSKLINPFIGDINLLPKFNNGRKYLTKEEMEK
jgi:hypothetical protein